MGLLQSLRESVWPSTAPISNQLIPSGSVTRGDSVFMSFGGSPVGQVPALTEDTARTVAAIEACVQVISGPIEFLPLNIYSRSGDGERQELPNERLWWTFNEEWHPRWTGAAGWAFLVRSRLLRGDAFVLIERNRDGSIRHLKPLHPDRVLVYHAPDDRQVYAVYPDKIADRNEVMVVDANDMIHVAGDGYDGIRTPSPLRFQLRMVGGDAMATQTYASNFFANGARPDYVIQQNSSAPPLTDEQFSNLKEQIDASHRGFQNSARPMLLEGGLEFKSITMPFEDAQLLETRKFQVEEIARAYCVPPFMIGHTEKSTSWGSGIEAMGTGFVRYTLRRHLHAITNEFNRKVFPLNYQRFCEFDTSELERADIKTMFDSFAVALGGQGKPGFMTQREVRNRLNLPSKGDDDTLEAGMETLPEQPSAE